MRRMNSKSKPAGVKEITLTERHLFRENDPEYKELDELTFKSKNLYNAALYAMRQFFFQNHYFPGYAAINKEFTHSNQPDYRALPAKVSKHVQMQADEACKSFEKLNKLYRDGDLKSKPNLPKYLHKQKGRQVLHYEKGAISKRFLKNGLIHLSKTNLYIPTKVDPSKVQFVRIVPKNRTIIVEVGYKEELPDLKQETSRVAALDLGLNNLAVCSSNVMTPILIDGRYLKSVNQRANKAIAAARSHEEVRHGKKTSPKIQAMYLRRNNRNSDYMHKATRYLVNQFVSNHIDTVIIGYNPGWKQDINIGTKNNQNFCQIPFLDFVNKLTYKCALEGIKVIVNEESYTSKCSFLDNEECRKHESYTGRRIHRGLFKSGKGRVMNADLNGSLNILKKGMQHLGQWNDSLYRQCLDWNKSACFSRYYVPRS